MNPIVQLQNVEKQFGTELVVKGIDLEVEKGEFLTILGPSGCGKTTTLRMIAGFETPTDGQILLEGQNVVDIPPYRRDVNTVFQSYALFPHMTVYENVAYGLRMKGVPKSAQSQRVQEVLHMVQLESLGNRKPMQLSGGQQQRVAVARALVNNPKVLLLDEPLGALDLKLRKQMQIELKHLQQQLGVTFIYITHDQEEALTMSDRIAVMNQGRIEQVAAPKDIYENPQSKYVADFIGETNLLEVKILSHAGPGVVLDFLGKKLGGRMGNNQAMAERMMLSVRPERIRLSKEADPVWPFALSGRVEEMIYVGSIVRTMVRLTDGTQIFTMTPSQGKASFVKGDQVWLSWEEEDGIVIGA
jgi:spermidine/putrescine transport system ATP-binding protein